MNKMRVLLAAVLVVVSSCFWLTKAQPDRRLKGEAQEASSQDQNQDQPCVGGPPQMSFEEAREAFIKRGLRIRGQGTVTLPRDLVGSVMILTPFRAWLYVTNVELRYDSKASALAFSRLEGYLPDGRPVREDSTQKLPASFQIVDKMSQIGSAILVIGGVQQKARSVSYSITSRGLLLIAQSCDWCQNTEDTGGGDGGGQGPCRMVASVTVMPYSAQDTARQLRAIRAIVRIGASATRYLVVPARERARTT